MTVVVWRSCIASWSRLTKLTDVGPGYYWGGWPCSRSISDAEHLSRHVTSHPGQLSLATPSWVGAMSTSERVATPCGWGVKADVVRVWVAGKAVWSQCYLPAIAQRFGDKGLIIKRYINSSVYFILLTYVLYVLPKFGILWFPISQKMGVTISPPAMEEDIMQTL